MTIYYYIDTISDKDFLKDNSIILQNIIILSTL